MTSIAKVKALTNSMWSGGEEEKDYQFEEKKVSSLILVGLTSLGDEAW